MTKILIRCSQPGFRRAGVSHEASRIWPAAAFSAKQLDAMRAEPALSVSEIVDGDGGTEEIVLPLASPAVQVAAYTLAITDLIDAALLAIDSPRRAAFVGDAERILDSHGIGWPIAALFEAENSEDQPATQVAVQTAEPEPIDGAQAADEAGASAPIAASDNPPTETGQTTDAEPAAAPVVAPATPAKTKKKPAKAKASIGTYLSATGGKGGSVEASAETGDKPQAE